MMIGGAAGAVGFTILGMYVLPDYSMVFFVPGTLIGAFALWPVAMRIIGPYRPKQ
jgi:hypothetical protein